MTYSNRVSPTPLITLCTAVVLGIGVVVAPSQPVAEVDFQTHLAIPGI